MCALSRRLELSRQFCVWCGAGVGQYRRDGEGTCPACDPEGAAANTARWNARNNNNNKGQYVIREKGPSRGT